MVRPEKGITAIVALLADKDARIGVVAPYVIVHDYRPDDVMIPRIADGRRNITRQWCADD